MGKKSKPPAPDPRIGEAAMASAQLGQDYLAWAKGQSAISNQWAAEDRARQKTVFQPLEDQYIKDAQEWDGAARMGARVNEATAATQSAIGQQQAQMERQQAAMGVSPNSGRSAALGASSAITAGLAVAGAGNAARGQVRQEAQNMRANSINMGNKLAVNPGTSLGLSSSTMGAGFGGAMQGYGQQGSLLNTQFSQQMDQYNANQSRSAGFWGGLGNIAGIGLGMLSDENAKEDIRPAPKGFLNQVKQLPVSEWKYKDGQGDGGEHVGTMAQDWQAATGRGTGKTIDVVDYLGTLTGAVQELTQEVELLRGAPPPSRGRRAPTRPAQGRTLAVPASTARAESVPAASTPSRASRIGARQLELAA